MEISIRWVDFSKLDPWTMDGYTTLRPAYQGAIIRLTETKGPATPALRRRFSLGRGQAGEGNGLAAISQSVGTFTRGTLFKASFLVLVYLDLLLTLVALDLGYIEMNSYMLRLLSRPPELLMVKGATPVLIAWLVPAPLLLPAIGFMLAVSVWNIGQLLISL